MLSKKVVIIIVLALTASAYLVLHFGKDIPRNDIFLDKNYYIQEYSLPKNSAPNGLVVDKNGLVWVTTKGPVLYSINPSDGKVENHEIKSTIIPYENERANSTMVWTILQEDGKIWFSPYGGLAIWGFDPVQDTFDAVKIENGTPFQMKTRDGAIWFTTLRGNTMGVMAKAQNGMYKISEFNVGNNTNPAGIFLQNNSVWIADVGSQDVRQYEINRQGGGVSGISLVKKIPTGNSSLFSSPTDLFVYKNTIWLTEHGTSFLTGYDLNNGTIIRYPTSQNTFHTTTLPFWIRGTSEPNVLWFNEHQGNKIGRFDMNNKTLVEYSIPSLPDDGYLTYPLNLSQDPADEKVLWFSEWNTDKIGVINGHLPIPFGMDLDTAHVVLDHGKSVTVGMKISSNEHHPVIVSLNASSTITPTAELGSLGVKFTSNTVDASQNGTVRVSLYDGGIAPGNYTVGLSVSDGLVTITKFLDLAVENR